MINVTCPMCQRAMQGQDLSSWPEFPFCSQRCKLIDLGRWLKESYAIPAEEAEEDSFPEKLDPP